MEACRNISIQMESIGIILRLQTYPFDESDVPLFPFALPFALELPFEFVFDAVGFGPLLMTRVTVAPATSFPVLSWLMTVPFDTVSEYS